MIALDMSDTNLDELSDLSHLSIQSIDLRRNSLKGILFESIPLGIQNLSLDDNDIHNLEFDILFQNLKSISASRNKLIYVDVDFPQPSLEHLDLSRNYIHQIQFLQGFPSLKHLNISFNDVEVLANLPPSLETLKASWCKIKMIQSRFPPNIREVELVGNALRMGSLPWHWGTNLRVLKLGYNQLKEFPKRLPDSLEEIYLQKNEIAEFPKKLPKNLQILSLVHNKIREIPKEMNIVLKTLLIGHNHLTSTKDIPWIQRILEEKNWNQDEHHTAQKRIAKCYKRFLLQKRLRHIYRARIIFEELLMVALHPDRVLQTDTFSPEWFNCNHKYPHPSRNMNKD